jgi:hypothetical protein
VRRTTISSRDFGCRALLVLLLHPPLCAFANKSCILRTIFIIVSLAVLLLYAVNVHLAVFAVAVAGVESRADRVVSKFLLGLVATVRESGWILSTSGLCSIGTWDARSSVSMFANPFTP